MNGKHAGTVSKRVVVAMSGGVDSSVTAALLKDQGFEVVGVTLQIWERTHDWGGCCGLGAIADAKRVARLLDIPHYVMNFRERFYEEIVANFCQEYARGRTPNPCIRCNQSIKFDALLHKAAELDAEYLATGHYARIDFDSQRQRYFLKKGLDTRKDQSYVLYGMTQEQLQRTLLPLGNFSKDQVRQRAREKKLPVAEKPDSQEICFIPDNDYCAFLRQAMPDHIVPGPVVDTTGKVLGQHQGLPLYTVGQRKRLNIQSGSQPWYVVALDVQRNTVIVGSKQEAHSSDLIASDLNWIAIARFSRPMLMNAKIRHQHQEAEALCTPLEEGKAHVRFSAPQMAITPGQAVVLYDGDLVLGGGTIERTSVCRSNS